MIGVVRRTSSILNFGGSVYSVRRVRTSVVTADFTENGEQQDLGPMLVLMVMIMAVDLPV